VIGPNPKLVASAASEEAQINENFAQLAVTEYEGLQEDMGLFEIIAKNIGSPIKVFHSSKNTKILDCGVGEKGKLIEILFDYNNNAQWTCADQEMWFPTSDPSNFQPFTTKNIYEAIAHSTEGRYTAQDLIELQIAPPPEVASPASEEVLTPISHNDEESMEKLAVALNQKLLVREDQKVKELYGMGCTGKEEDDIMISYDTKQRKYTYQNRMPGSLGVFSSPNMYEAIAIRTNGRYTAQDLLELQRSNFQAITATSQGSMLTSDGDKKPAFNQNSTPFTASNSEQEQQHSVQLGPAPLDPGYEGAISLLFASMGATDPEVVEMYNSRTGVFSYDFWKETHRPDPEITQKIVKEQIAKKVGNIIKSALAAFREKFDAIRAKLKSKLDEDVEKSVEEANELQQKDQAEYDAKAQAIHQQKAQEIGAMKQKLQSSFDSQSTAIFAQKQKEMDTMQQQIQQEFNSQVDAMVQRKQGEYDAFVQQKQSEIQQVFSLRKQAAEISLAASTIGGSIIIDTSDVAAKKKAELNAFKSTLQASTDSERDKLQSQMNARIQGCRSSKQEEASKEVNNLQQQINNQLQQFRETKKAEGTKECEALRASMESQLKSKQESKIKELVQAAAGKEKTQVDEFNRKVTDISENTSFLERLKDAVISSGDASAEALINEELNVVLQGVASDFGVDAVTL
jgi:hypothetical protein